jgi:3-phosphoshikimate 1-carboxyvinyltransferase
MSMVINPASIKGSLRAPASKSVMQRVCAAALLHRGTTTVQHYGDCDDDKVALQIIQHLGATVAYLDDTTLQIVSNGIPEQRLAQVHIDCGESGLSLRMFAPIALLFAEEVIISGRGSLLRRPVQSFAQILPPLGVSVKHDQFPLVLKGTIRPTSVCIDGSLSSQYLTGLLFTYAVLRPSSAHIKVMYLTSKPYIDLTMQVMEHFGMTLPLVSSDDTFTWPGRGGSAPTNISYDVEGDWSNAAFWLVAAAIAGEVTVQGLDAFSAQGDKRILEALQECGAILSIEASQTTVRRAPLRAFHFDATQAPDLFPPLVALASFCEGTTVIEGVHRLTYKESNRAESLMSNFRKLGVDIQLQDDKMIVRGTCTADEVVQLDSFNDHRIAMACAIAALRSKKGVCIDGAAAVSKSYPKFFEMLSLLTSGC